jgi:hypothetical protein
MGPIAFGSPARRLDMKLRIIKIIVWLVSNVFFLALALSQQEDLSGSFLFWEIITIIVLLAPLLGMVALTASFGRQIGPFVLWLTLSPLVAVLPISMQRWGPRCCPI